MKDAAVGKLDKSSGHLLITPGVKKMILGGVDMERGSRAASREMLRGAVMRVWGPRDGRQAGRD